ncbi:hypothetical protein [Shewanella xiamenensis]|uniref:hypothetical protein n=1 Tax=Shewanella xiamenensis TaxID=332186 RepID=UPI0004D84742|nr:hypothetical protein [Shewanella xiamenensis]KEK28564.1 alpha/beta hydrolase fold domain-containing protein [Shewanella xiamenensis]
MASFVIILSNTASNQLWAAFRYHSSACLCVPVSILSGDRDGLIKIQTSRALVQYFKVDLVVLAYSPEQDTGEQFADSADLLNE